MIPHKVTKRLPWKRMHRKLSERKTCNSLVCQKLEKRRKNARQNPKNRINRLMKATIFELFLHKTERTFLKWKSFSLNFADVKELREPRNFPPFIERYLLWKTRRCHWYHSVWDKSNLFNLVRLVWAYIAKINNYNFATSILSRFCNILSDILQKEIQIVLILGSFEINGIWKIPTTTIRLKIRYIVTAQQSSPFLRLVIYCDDAQERALRLRFAKSIPK